MLYAVLGALLEKAAAVLRSPALDGPGEVGALQRRRVAALVARVGRMWPFVHPALAAQNAALYRAALAARAELRSHGGAADPAELPTPDAEPVRAHLVLLDELDRLVVALHGVGDEPWAAAARRRLRRSLADAARIESELVDR